MVRGVTEPCYYSTHFTVSCSPSGETMWYNKCENDPLFLLKLSHTLTAVQSEESYSCFIVIAFYLENTANNSGESQRYFSLTFHHTPFHHGEDVHPERERERECSGGGRGSGGESEPYTRRRRGWTDATGTSLMGFIYLYIYI